MKTIWKFPIAITDTQPIEVPEGALILSAQVQHGRICLWALVDTTERLTVRHIEVHGTGNPISPGNRRFISTVQTVGGSFVWHIFETLQ